MKHIRMMLAMLGMMLGRPFGLRMQNCREVAQLLSDYLDNELPRAPKQSIELHLLACPSCRNYVDTLRQTQGLLAEIRYADIPAEFRLRLHAVLARHLHGSH